MFEIKTKYGSFGSHTDLLRFMKEENFQEIEYTPYHCLQKMGATITATQEDVERILKKEV